MCGEWGVCGGGGAVRWMGAGLCVCSMCVYVCVRHGCLCAGWMCGFSVRCKVCGVCACEGSYQCMHVWVFVWGAKSHLEVFLSTTASYATRLPPAAHTQ